MKWTRIIIKRRETGQHNKSLKNLEQTYDTANLHVDMGKTHTTQSLTVYKSISNLIFKAIHVNLKNYERWNEEHPFIRTTLT